MNLIQIQDRLKDLPTQAIMGYANGENPQVPPYLALGELNRRKQMEKQPAQAPQGTVKDNIEQQVGLLSLQKLRQGQMAQQSAMQGAQAPTIPEGSPEPTEQPEEEMAMAAGGITRLPAGDMSFASGGIIAFAEGDLVIDEAARAAESAKQRLRQYGTLERRKDPEGYAAAQQADAQAQAAFQVAKQQYERQMAEAGVDKAAFNRGDVGALKAQMGLGATAPAAQQVSAQPAANVSNQSAAETARLLRQNAGIGSITPPPAPSATPAAPSAPPMAQMPQAPAAPAPVSAAMQLLNSEMSASTRPTPLTEFAPPKQTPIGEEYLRYVAEREGKSKQDDERFKQREADRAKRDFFQALIDSGEASRGQKGIGAVFGGFGRSAGRAATEADERQIAYEKVQQERQDNNAKLKFEIANLRRAEERGDAKSVYDSKVKIFEYQQKDRELAVQAAGQTARIESAERISDKEIGSRERTAALDRQARASVAGMPSAEQRMAEKVIGSYLEKNPGKSYFEGFQAYRNAQTGSGERQDLNELKTLQKVYSDSVANPLTPAAQKAKDAALLEGVNAKISQMAGIGSIAGGKTMSMADVKTTAASSGKTEQQVIEAAKARGYTIQ
tara:strand:+ start:1065 stop:2906 length:1842 start_codon:yes stop_codon:yes gene_type:complete